MPTPRQELIEIEKRLVKELKQRLYNTQERNDRRLDRYYADYQREFGAGFERPASRSELTDQLARAHIAYFGDYHTLRSAQSAMLSLLRETHLQRKRKVVLAVEMLHSAQQPWVQALVNGDIAPRDFRKKVRWKHSWGFPWSSYKRFFEFAATHDAPLVGLNIEPGERRNDLAFRDEFAAHIIAALTHLYPNRLIAVLYGDLHLAQNHLPSQVDAILARFGTKRHILRVYQNSETVYWRLAEKGLERVVDLVRVKRDVYCVMNATPLVKFQSFSNWQERTQELEFMSLEQVGRELPGEMMLLDQVAKYAQTICGFLGLQPMDTGSIEIATTADLDFLSRLEQRGMATAQEVESLKQYVSTAESAYFPRLGVLFLAYLSVSHAAEGAMRVLLAALRPPSLDPIEARDEFYARVMNEALVFFGSKIINLKRRCRGPAEWRQLVIRHGRARKLSPPQKLDLDVARAFMRHNEYEQRVLAAGAFGFSPKNLYNLDTPVHVALTRALGRHFGDAMFEAVLRGRLDKALVRGACGENLRAPNAARKLYFSLLEQMSKPGRQSDDTDWRRRDEEE